MSNPRPLLVVGAGVVGLMVAFLARHRSPTRRVVVIDAGPDPRAQPGLTTTFGATWSGLDARHISMTETGPWTASHRIDLMGRPPVDGGWNCLTHRPLDEAETSWVAEFCTIAADTHLHQANAEAIYALNRSGLDAWSALTADHPDTLGRAHDAHELDILCEHADLDGEHTLETALDPDGVSRSADRPPASLRWLTGDDGAAAQALGSFTVRGSAFFVKELAARLIDDLESTGVVFRWDTFTDLDDLEHQASAPSDVVWAAGTSAGRSVTLAGHGVNLQGVMGCWLHLRGAPPTGPFKVLAREPVNFVNCTSTPAGLLVSGCYGWVGRSTHREAGPTADVLVEMLEAEVRRLLPGLAPYPAEGRAHCLRPVTPSGRPVVRMLPTSGRHRVALCVGHAAGGFTQAPFVGAQALDLLDERPAPVEAPAG